VRNTGNGAVSGGCENVSILEQKNGFALLQPLFRLSSWTTPFATGASSVGALCGAFCSTASKENDELSHLYSVV
jgi:hypothetical protein